MLSFTFSWQSGIFKRIEMTIKYIRRTTHYQLWIRRGAYSISKTLADASDGTNIYSCCCTVICHVRVRQSQFPLNESRRLFSTFSSNRIRDARRTKRKVGTEAAQPSLETLKGWLTVHLPSPFMKMQRLIYPFKGLWTKNVLGAVKECMKKLIRIMNFFVGLWTDSFVFSDRWYG